jgi:hypothetical protein
MPVKPKLALFLDALFIQPWQINTQKRNGQALELLKTFPKHAHNKVTENAQKQLEQ